MCILSVQCWKDAIFQLIRKLIKLITVYPTKGGVNLKEILEKSYWSLKSFVNHVICSNRFVIVIWHKIDYHQHTDYVLPMKRLGANNSHLNISWWCTEWIWQITHIQRNKQWWVIFYFQYMQFIQPMNTNI